MDTLQSLEALGLTLPSPAYIAGAIAFGLVGLFAYMQGKRTQRRSTRWLGVALMVYPYAVSSTWALYVVGAVLCAAVWFDRR